MDSVPRFDEFFGLYQQEHTFLNTLKSGEIWNANILSSKNYAEYTRWHLKELTRLRFLPKDWPVKFQRLLSGLSGEQLFILSNTEPSFSTNELGEVLNGNTNSTSWIKAKKIAEEKTKQAGLDLKDFSYWSGEDLILDFYRLRNADKLALPDIGADRMQHYELLFQSLLNHTENKTLGELRTLAVIFQKLSKGAPADHFSVHLEKGTVTEY